MIKEVGRRSWRKDGDPAIEIVYECEYGVICSKPRYAGGEWVKLENDAYKAALEKYKELLKQNNKLFEV